jgi:2-polyprenyl-3-methyl-5-hydroxy-6-metoxy-1,4-benzoquinol methylase
MIDNPHKYYDSLKKESLPCPVCDTTKNTVLLNKDRYSMGIQTVICEKCALIHVNPRPTEKEMSRFYEENYREFYESIDVPTEEYINNGPFIPRASFVMDVLKPYFENTNSIIDIGCAEGTLLKLVEQNYSEISTTGLEPSKSFGNYAKEHLKGEVFVGTYQEFLAQNPARKFDVLTTTHVLEHILSPKEFLNGIKTFMHDESVLYVEVPNILDDKVKGIGAVHLGHVLSLEPDTLNLLLETCGFEIIDFFIGDLPALTPAMGVLCRKSKNTVRPMFPEKNSFKIKREAYLKRVNPDALEVPELKKPSILQRIKRKLLN